MSGGVGDAAEDYAEMDAYMKQVEARDLIEFGMIPVRYLVTRLNHSISLQRRSSNTYDNFIGICWAIPSPRSIPLS